MPLTLAPTATGRTGRRAATPAVRVAWAVVLLVALTLGAILGWHLGIASPTDTAQTVYPAATPAASSARPAAHAALVTLTPATGVTDLAHLDRPLSPTRIQRLATRTAPGIVTLTTNLGDGHGEAGTGIVIATSGTVLTNCHVITGYHHTNTGDSISAVDLGNGRTYPVTVLGRDPDHDIALVQLVGAHDLPTAHLGDSHQLYQGMQLASLGNAYGQGELAIGTGPLVATGQTITSTTGQTRPLTGLLRVHTGLVPGQSGGPLVDRDGHIVGINVAYLAHPDHTPTGDGYAIPWWAALHAAHHLLGPHHHGHPHPHRREHTRGHHTTHHILRRAG